MKKKVRLTRTVTTEEEQELIIMVDISDDCDDDEIEEFVEAEIQFFDEPDWFDEWQIVDSSTDYGDAQVESIENEQDVEQNADLVLRRDMNGTLVAISA